MTFQTQDLDILNTYALDYSPTGDFDGELETIVQSKGGALYVLTENAWGEEVYQYIDASLVSTLNNGLHYSYRGMFDLDQDKTADVLYADSQYGLLGMPGNPATFDAITAEDRTRMVQNPTLGEIEVRKYVDVNGDGEMDTAKEMMEMQAFLDEPLKPHTRAAAEDMGIPMIRHYLISPIETTDAPVHE